MARIPQKPKQSNRGKALTAEKREVMFQVFFEHGTVLSVAQECTVNRRTVIKYRKNDMWDHRIEETKRKAAEKVDNTNAKRIAENMTLVDSAKDAWLASLMGEMECPHCGKQVAVPRLKPKFIDIDKLIRLDVFLCGLLDSRPDVDVRYEYEYEDVPIEELEKRLQQLKAQLKSLGLES